MINNKIFWVIGLNLAIVFGTFAYLLADNQLPYEWESGYVKPNPAPNGSQISVCWKLRIKRFCPGTIQRQIIDSRDEVHNYDPILAADEVDVGDPFCVTFKLPAGLSPGIDRYRVHATYYCNPLQYVWPLRATTPEIPFSTYDPEMPK